MKANNEAPGSSPLAEESHKAYAAFLAYRDLGPGRSLRQVSAQLGKQLSLIKRWSTRHQWQARAQAWDESRRSHEEQVAQQAREAAYQRRQANAEQIEKFAMAGLRSLMVRDRETGELRFDPRLKPTDIASLIRVAAQIFPTPVLADEIDADQGPQVLGKLSDQDVQLLIGILEGQAENEG